MSAEAPTTDACPSSAGNLQDALTEELSRRWRAGERPCAEEFLERHQELQNDPEAAIGLIYEEICLRQEFGETVPVEEIVARFPQWRQQLLMLLDCHQLLKTPAPTLPSLAESFEDFVLLAELGRGGQGRVFLASQPALGDRLVVLKTTPRTGAEHLALARLQHTHIMPLYAAHEDLERNLRILCMPYFGGGTLMQVLDELHDIRAADRTGRHLLEALDRAAEKAVAQPISKQHADISPQMAAAAAGPIRQLLAGSSYVEAICWIGACLADALQYAHERGLVHLDLKPSNVLLAADGQPMLLDFHVAQKPIQPDQPHLERLGGTPRYMSPEQHAAMSAMEKGQATPSRVDGQSDLYSLGLLLYEGLSGTIRLLDQAAIPSLSDCNPQVSVGLADIISKCLQAEPRDRYATAAALAADLRRHLHNHPLQEVRNRSLTERWRKWRQRHPYSLALGFMGIAVLTAALSMGLFAFRHAGQQRRDAQAALVEGQTQITKGLYAPAVDTLKRGLAHAENVPGGSALTSNLQAQLQLARRGQAAEHLHLLAERLRFLHSATLLPASEASTLIHRWRAVWEKRSWLLERRGGALEATIEQRLDADLLDLGIIGAHLCVRLAEPNAAQEAHREALQVLADTEALFGPSQILCQQREIIARALGQTKLADNAGRRAAELTPHSAWEHYALGRSLLQADELEQAAVALKKAVELHPNGFWPNFYQGLCSYRQRRFDDAVAAFRVCVALAPDNAECYYNRALAHAERGDNDLALHDYDRALQLNPHLAAAALNRGRLHFSKKNYAEARSDFNRALDRGFDPAIAQYNLALTYWAQNDSQAAVACLERALQANADHVAARTLLNRLQHK
jgi:eukaryotic-like serine/threonine-protein kinase